MHTSRLALGVLAAALLGLGGCGEDSGKQAASDVPEQSGPRPLHIAVVPKGTTHEFWKTVHAGAVKAERELEGVKTTFRGPEREDDREQQISLVENLVSGDYDAIVLAPLDDRALVAPVRLAMSSDVPVVIIDSGLEGEAGTDYVSFVATDNFKGGQIAGQKMGELLGGTGSVLMLRYQEGSASTRLREEGFLDAMQAFPDITMIDPKRFAGATRDTAQQAAENLLQTYTDLNGVFAPNESSTFGMLLALRSRGLTGKLTFIGFDASEGLLDGMRKGEIQGLVVQDPMKMGYLGVKTAVEHLRGQAVEPRIDTGVVLITPESIDSPEMDELINPDLDQFLGGD